MTRQQKISHLYCLSDIFLLVQLSFSPGTILCVNPGHMIIPGPTPTSLPRFRFLRRTKPFARPRWRPWLDTDVLVFHRASALSVNEENGYASNGKTWEIKPSKRWRWNSTHNTVYNRVLVTAFGSPAYIYCQVAGSVHGPEIVRCLVVKLASPL